ncbi:MAG: type III secretion system chaperone [Pseudomonadota bacterium]
MKIEDLSQALVEAGKRFDPVVVTAFEESMAYLLTFVDGTTVTIERDENRRVLVFVGHLGETPAGRESAISDLLMSMNALWAQLGGLRFGRGPDGTFLLFWDLPYDPLDTEGFVAMTGSFAERTSFWRLVVLEGKAADGDQLDTSDDIIRA